MPWMGVGVYLPAPAPSWAPAGFAGLDDLDDFAVFAVFDPLVLLCFFAAPLRAVGFLAAARFFMARTVPPVRVPVNAPAGAAAHRSAASGSIPCGSRRRAGGRR